MLVAPAPRSKFNPFWWTVGQRLSASIDRCVDTAVTAPFSTDRFLRYAPASSNAHAFATADA